MSSPYDGNGGDDRYSQLNAPPNNELHRIPNSQHQQQQPNTAHLYTPAINDGIPLQQPPQNHLIWQNAVLGAPYIQTAMLQNQQQQHQYNEFLYNMHVPQAYNMPAPQPETYSVLPVGHGNFLKIYHCPDSASKDGGVPTEMTQQHFQQHYQGQQHPTAAYHLNQQPTAQPQYFNNYELFSSGTLLTPHESGLHIPNTPQQSSQPVQQQQKQQSQPQQPKISSQQPAINEQLTTTNLIINKLVNNWSPNLTGGTYTQFGSPLPTESTTETLPITAESDIQLTAAKVNINTEKNCTNIEDDLPKTFNASNTNEPTTATIISTAALQTKQQYKLIDEAVTNEPPQTKVLSCPASSVPVSSAPVPEVKKRIVAEVKPMRMTYSDVLSKLNSQQTTNGSNLVTKPNASKGKKSGSTSTLTNNERKNENKNVLRQTGNGETDTAAMLRNNIFKKSPTHDNKENQQINPTITATKIKKRSPINVNGTANSVNLSDQPKKITQQRPTLKTGSNSTTEPNYKKRPNHSKRSDSLSDTQSSNNSRSQKQEKDGYNAYYNITAKNNGDSRITNNNASSNGTTNTTQRKNANNKSGSSSSNHYSNHSNNSNNNSNNSYANHQSRTRYSNSNNSYSYSSKRSRANNSTISYGSSLASSITSNRNYELAKKILRTWGNYMLKAIIWLYYLLYDIIVLSCGIIYERLTNAFISGYAYARQLHTELKQNYKKPSLWIKNYWRRFDSRFAKDSRWAIWRKLNKKKPPEPTTENFKNGRLPSTGEEAMYSLLNCKGKDAYSILGVPPNCPQEQIRKHYKKIAVLVHPDKNKQAGAEEAFKVLQRAFELIGEPENRLAYDQSLVEALHAEKAWTELHDLLSQLQNKITEAANTIRCSTCAQRHPRKIVDRPHYAARECGACKMRHSAREGDIWAETSLLGIRWKYLALMEGKVYDITEWANCQKGALAHLEPNSHMVQYRIVRGAQQQQQQQHQQQSKREAHSKRHQYTHTANDAQQPFPPGAAPWERGGGTTNFQHDIPQNDANFKEFPFNLYGSQNPNQSNASAYSGSSSRRRTRRN